MHPSPLILASMSPRRSDLLRKMELVFETIPAHVNEDDSGDKGPHHMVLENAKLKAEAISRQYPDALVLGSDTTVALGDLVLSKPIDLDDACRMLKSLSGKTHTVYTAVSLQWKAGSFSDHFVETSDVTFKDLDDAIITAYFEKMNPLDKAGAYGIQEESGLIIASFQGSIENVMGLPIQVLDSRLREHGFDFRCPA